MSARAHGVSRLYAVLAFTAWCGLSRGQLMFVVEPPGRLWYSNSTGARVHCAAHGSHTSGHGSHPSGHGSHGSVHGSPPTVSWLQDDGSPLQPIPGLRETLPNGTLWLPPFSAAQYRGDVHAAVYRCRAASSAGTILSRDMRVHAVMDTWWEPRVTSTRAGAGGAALLTCSLPPALRAHITVLAWYKDDQPLPTIPVDAGGRYIVAGGRNDALIVRDVRIDEPGAYACEARHALTGEKRRSATASITVTELTSSIAPRILAVSEDETVMEGEDIRLVCCAIGHPPPTYSWFREWNGRVSGVSSGVRVSVWEGVVLVRGARGADAGGWTCRAHNALGEQRRDATLHVRTRLRVAVHPQLLVANSGSSVTFNCSVEGAGGSGGAGGGGVRVRWLHDGVPVGGGERALHVHGVARAHRGMYQCFADRDQDTAQAAAELRLGDTAPELHYTFIEQALHPGPALALQCAASGSPPPRFTWLIDSQPLEEHNTPQRSITQFMSSSGDVVSYLNISSVRPEDGGRYTCRAHNSRGAAEHSTRLNVYGPPSIRNIGPVRVVAGVNTTIHCPYSGFPISEIRWQRGGMDVSSAGGRTLSGAGGELLLWPAEQADAGLYSCRVVAPSGQYAMKDVQIFVRNPPKIAGFSFPTDLVEGSSIQVLCGITSGDKPVYFSWLKDGQHIPSSLQVQEKSLEEFSFLIFSHVTSKHSGDYTCVASNSAAEVNHTARLAVKVAPTWIYEPQDVSALLGTQILAHCATRGYPEPRITWLKGHGTNLGDFRPVSNLDLQYSIMSNGSLSISPAAHHHEGQYMCRAENGIGRGLSKVIAVSVNEPAHFEYSSRNLTVERTGQVGLLCEARGDPPITLQWTHNMKRVDPITYRTSVSEKRLESGAISQLNIANAERQDSGVYRCRAENAYGRDELLIYLAVQEFPEAPRGLQVSGRRARGAALRWRRGYDGNARVRTYRLQYRVVGDTRRAPAGPHPPADDWRLAPTRDIPADRIHEKRESQDPSSEVMLEYLVEGLRPATAYALRLAAVNDIGDSGYSDPVILQTMEEAPSEPPHNVQVQATAPGELLVKWQAPPQDSWNGELLGYVVTYRPAGAAPEPARALTAAGWGAARALLGALRTHAHYELRVRAYNAVGAGPPSAPLTATTLEGVPEAPPERVGCEPLSAQSVRVWWEPPPPQARGGVLLGYELLYQMMDSLEGGVESRLVGGTESVVGGLARAANYSVSLRARTAAGPGPASPPLYCVTHEDIPGPPADVKALASSEDSVVVSWLVPAQPNGKIKHYTVYNRPQRTGQHAHLVVLHRPSEQEYSVEVGGLQPQTYEFWVTAATAAGEGDATTVVGAKPNARAPAKITSFGRRVVRAAGRRVVLSCGAVGAPAPLRTWSRRRPAPPLAGDPRVLLEGHHLVILSLDRSLSDNYTCVVRNPWGEERATWWVVSLGAPGAPRLSLSAAGAARLTLVWQLDADPLGATPAVHDYTLEYCRQEESRCESVRLPGSTRAHSLERLSCGAHYRLRLVAHNAVGAGPHSNELIVSTQGGRSKPAPEKDLITSNSTCVRLNLLTWDSNGCPLIQFEVSLRSISESTWRSETVAAGVAWGAGGEGGAGAEGGAGPTVLCELAPATWYQLKIVVTSTAGVTPGNYYFSTLTEDGERIPAPSQFPAEGGAGAGGRAVLLAAGGALLAAGLLLLAALGWRRSRSKSCVRAGYSQGDLSEEDKCVERRDNRRNTQQVYTSEPGKHPGKKDHQEMYEISPYATFSMSGGATERAEDSLSMGGVGGVSGGVGGGTLRTFGRAEPPLLSAAPPRQRHNQKHRSPTNSDEYTLSRAMTLMVRRGGSDSDSSGSPCADCSSVSYRMPLPANNEESVRGVTDSSAESTATGGTGGAGGAGGAGGPGAAGGGERAHRPHPHDKARRRARRHHTPTSSRYQQRQEQERRDFTIHV